MVNCGAMGWSRCPNPRGWGVLGLSLAGCIPAGSFACAEDGECGPQGRCEAVGYCSVPDRNCASGRAYSRYSPRDLAQSCVDEVAGGSSGAAEATGTTEDPDATLGSDSDPAGQTSTSGAASSEASSGDDGLVSDCLAPGRDPAPPVLLYDFCEGMGASVQSITEATFPLEFENGALGDGFEWVEDGLLLNGDTFDATTALRSFEPVFDRLDACIESGEVTVEVWATPLSDSQGGPTGIVAIGTPEPNRPGTNVAISMNPQWKDSGYVAVVSTSESSEVSMPWLGTPLLRPNHLVLVHEAAGVDRLYLDGEEIVMQAHPGDLSSWNPNYDLVLGNKPNYDVRNWQGTYHLVAIYCEALSPSQVMTNFDAGHRPG